jgi:1,4-alpha-glucan branching enzyme
MPVPAYAKQGVTLPSTASGDSTTFVVRAPGRSLVKIRIAPLGQSPASATGIVMRLNTDNYTWWINLKLAAGTYQYLYEMPDGTTLYDPWGRYNGTSGSRFTIGAEGLTADDYVWQTTSWQRPPLNKLAIYELNLQEAVGGYFGRAAGQETFTDLISLLPHYDSLGINAIELMPINDFGSVGQSGFSWGYDLNTDLALEPGYGTPHDLKVLVDSAHARGIAIILDVVFNQLNGTGPLWQIAPQIGVSQYFKNATDTRPNEDPTSYFQDLDHWTTYTQEYVYTALKMWIDDYRIDGFRYDFTKGIGWDPTQPTKGILGWANRIDTEYSGKIYQTAEHLPESPTLIHMSGLTSGWHDAFHDEMFNEASQKSTSLDNFENYILDLAGYTSSDVPNTQSSYDDRTNPVNMTVNHDEQSLIYEMTQFQGVSSSDALKRDKLYGTFIFTSLGVPFLWEGMEYGEPRGWPNSDTRMSYRPVQFSLASTSSGQSHFEYYKKLIYQRLHNPALYQGRLRRLYKYYGQKSLVWGFEDTASTAKVMCVANLTNSTQTITNVPWLATGTWYDIFDNSQFQASGTTISSFTIPAYTARVFTNIIIGNPPQFQASADTLIFGDVTRGSSSAMAVTLSNTGGDSLIISSITSSNSAFVVKTSTARLSASRTFTDSIRFTPSHVGADSTIIVITSNSNEIRDTIWAYGNGLPLVLPTPALIIPADQAVNLPLITHLRWGRSNGASKYVLQVSIDSLFGSFVVNDTISVDTSAVKSLTLGESYFWRVKALNTYGESAWPSTWKFTITATQFTVSVPLNARWNLVSAPVLAPDMRPGSIFTGAVSQAYAFNDGYIIKDTLIPGTGYWLKFNSAQTLTITGDPILAESIAVTAGWNLIGAISTPIAASSVGSSMPGMITGNFFTFSGSYAPADSLRPGNGYWVKVTQDGQLILSLSTAQASKNRIRIVPTSELPPSPPSGESFAAALPKQYLLEQNYPNPFNPSTIIKYDLPNDGYVTLSVFNMLGQQIATLVDGYQEAGYKSVKFEMDNVPSGVYIYRLTAGTYTDIKKMILIR